MSQKSVIKYYRAIFYAMVKNKTSYDDTKVGLDEKKLLELKIKRTQRALDKLNSKKSTTA